MSLRAHDRRGCHITNVALPSIGARHAFADAAAAGYVVIAVLAALAAVIAWFALRNEVGVPQV